MSAAITKMFLDFIETIKSPKTAINLLIILIIAFSSWSYIYPIMLTKELGIKEEWLLTGAVIFSILIGSLVSSLIYLIYDWLIKDYRKKKNIAIEIANREAEEKQKNENINKRLHTLIDHLSLQDRYLMYDLTQYARTISYEDKNNSVLLAHEFIQNIGMTQKHGEYIHGGRFLVQLNPIIQDTVQNHFTQYKKNEVKNFLEYQDNAHEILKLLEKDNIIEQVSLDLMKSIPMDFSPITAGMTPGSHDAPKYWVSFERFMLEAFEEHTGKEYVDEIEIPDHKIVGTAIDET